MSQLSKKGDFRSGIGQSSAEFYSGPIGLLYLAVGVGPW